MNRENMINALMNIWYAGAQEDVIFYYRESQWNYYNSLSDDELFRKYAEIDKPITTGNQVPHVHAELIKQWADGAVIQELNKYDGCWYDTHPSWDEYKAYRIKPESKWYDNIPKKGILCWVTNANKQDDWVVVNIGEYNTTCAYPFIPVGLPLAVVGFKHARPLTNKEITDYFLRT